MGSIKEINYITVNGEYVKQLPVVKEFKRYSVNGIEYSSYEEAKEAQGYFMRFGELKTLLSILSGNTLHKHQISALLKNIMNSRHGPTFYNLIKGYFEPAKVDS